MLLDVCGFEMRSLEGDRLRMLGVSANQTWVTATAPGSVSTRAFYSTGNNYRFQRTWLEAVSSTNYGFVGCVDTSASNDGIVSFGVGYGANVGLGIGWDPTTKMAQLMIGSTILATSATVAFTGTWNRVRLTAQHVNGGLVQVWVDGVLAITYTLTPSDLVTLINIPDSWYWAKYGGVPGARAEYDDFAAFDLDLIPVGFTIADYQMISERVHTVTGAGTRQEQASGTWDDIDELPISNADRIVYDSIGQGADFTIQPTSIGSRQIIAVIGTAAMERTGPAAGTTIKPLLRDPGGEVKLGALPVGPNGTIEWFYPTARNGNDWDQTGNASVNLHTFGMETE